MEVKPGYKVTDIGAIPEDWDVAALSQLGDCLIGLTYKPSDVVSHGLLVLRASNIQDGSLCFEDNVYVSVSVPEKIIARKGDILICVRNGSRPLIGKCIMIDDRAAGMTFGAFMAMLRSQSPRFVFQQFQSGLVKKQIHEHLGATINQITNKSLASFRIPYPPHENERDAIAEALEDADRLVETFDRLIAKKRDLKHAAMQQLLTGHTRLPGFSGEWEVKLLGSIGIFSKGKGIRKDDVRPDGLPCVRYGEIYTHHDNHIRTFYSHIAPAVAAQSQRLTKGDLLFTGSGETAEEIGKCVAFLGDEEAYAGGDIIILSPCGHDSAFLGYLLNHPAVASQKARMGQGDAVVHISARNLARVELSLPSPAEQTAIAAVLSDIDAEIDVLEAQRDKTRLLKQGMMQELLTGKTRLVAPDAAAAEAKADLASVPVVAAAPQAAAAPQEKKHSWAFNEAVVISVLAKAFGKEDFPLGRKRYTKLSYLLHRHMERKAEGYLKKAAGPYNPSTKYKGKKKIAQKNKYIRAHKNGQFSGFVAADGIAQAEGYFEKWYGPDALKWLGQFRYKKNDDLEVLATVDMAVQDLHAAGAAVTLDAVKGVIRSHPEWEAKLNRPVFADASIAAAMEASKELFG